jgi:Pup amidohydrolase
LNTIFGIETEYGIYVEGKDPSDLVNESIQVVRSYPGVYASPWDYRGEDSRRDMRGYRVDHLTVNPDDARYDRPTEKPLTVNEERSDRVLCNGARLYNDHGHPEYSTPECSTLAELIAHDRAGERIVLDCARRRSAHHPAVTIYKNNSDFHGMSFGCHESYLLGRALPFDALFGGMLPFLVTRQIFAGAGKVGAEVRPAEIPLFQLSQRADFFSVEASVDTLHQRPIFNTRDEPHADSRLYRRLHVICGDANLSEYATALKVGTTALVTELLGKGWRPGITIQNPVATIQNVSRDQSWMWYVPLTGGEKIRATELQRIYLEAATSAFSADADEDTAWVLEEWAAVLKALEKDPLELADRLDWVAKRSLLEQFLKEEGLDWDAELAQSLDLAYSNLDPSDGLFSGLEEMGAVHRLVSETDIERAMTAPPGSTRAWVRGEIVRRFSGAVQAISWNKISVEDGGQATILDLNPLVGHLDASLRERLAGFTTLADWAAALRSVPTPPAPPADEITV